MASTGQMTPPVAPGGNLDDYEPVKHAARRRRMRLVKRIGAYVLALALIAAAGFVAYRVYRALNTQTSADVPVTTVQRGDVALTITARGELRGGNPQSLTAPMTGGTEMHITRLLKTGQAVKKGDIVVQFDTSEQEYKLKEAEFDLAEAEQKLIQAKAQRDADREEDRYALLKAQTDLKLAELEARKNPLVSEITAKQNDLAVEGARDHLAQTEKNLKNRQATGEAGIHVQEAARAKAWAQAATARQNIEQMTLRADRDGYVAIKQNTATTFAYTGMVLPFFQLGDTVRPGMAVAEIPDLKQWEVSVKIGELDRGHLRPGDRAQITVVAIPGHEFHGRVRELGGMTGAFWDRHFECKLSLENPAPQLRPGMSTTAIITTDNLKNVLSLPAQALFESNGKTFAYLRSGDTFVPHDVALVRRSDTRAVITGLKEGAQVALANPLEMNKKKEKAAGPLETIGK